MKLSKHNCQPLAISKMAGSIDVPKKMFDEIVAWVESLPLDKMRAVHFFDSPMGSVERMARSVWYDFKSEKSFKIDISDTKQYANNKEQFDSVLRRMFRFKKLHVFFSFKMESGYDPRGEWWNPPTMVISGLDVMDEDKLKDTVAHELVHMMQDIMKHALSPDETEVGTQGPYEPETHMRYLDTLYSSQAQEHALSDLEFFPRLEESKIQMKAYVLGQPNRVEAFKQYMTQDETLKYMQAEKNISFGDFIELIPSEDIGGRPSSEIKDQYYAYIKRETDRYNKYVRELYRYFAEMQKTAGINIAMSARSLKLSRIN